MSSEAGLVVSGFNREISEALRLVEPGAPYRAVAECLARALGPRAHPLTRADFGGAIGLALEEPGCLNAARDGSFAAGEVFSARAGLRDDGASAVVSAVVLITDGGHEVFWPGAAA